MLHRIDLRNFKCFEVLKLPLRPLTLLSGANATGKSAVMHALVLLHQTMREHEWSSQLMLNGNTIRLGTAADVIDQDHGGHEYEMDLLDDETSYSWKFQADQRERMVMQVACFSIDGEEADESDLNMMRNLLPMNAWLNRPVESLAQRLRTLTYLQAERLGPREIYLLEDPQYTQLVGPKGEHAVSFLYANRDLPLKGPLVDPKVASTLLPQVEARMKRLFPGFGLAVQGLPQTNAATLGLRNSDDGNFLRPINTGFGLTQVLPIVVAALSTDRNGGLLLIENPEVHMHPAGQAAVGEFLGEVASSGVQVIIETHSDHVLNGIRRAVKRGALSSDEVALHFFRLRHEAENDGGSQVESPAMDANGNIDSWPKGFFDQFDDDMNYFAGWR